MAPSNISIHPPGMMESRPTFSHVTSSLGNNNRFICTAGQIGTYADGSFPAGRDEQIRLALKNLARCVEFAGAKVTDIQKLVYYIVDYDHTRRDHFEPMKEFLNGHRPATTLIAVPKLVKPGIIFEVEAYLSVAQHEPRQVDVVVVGAGLSGLSAAYEVQRAGLSVAVLEARDRVGGKTWSVDSTDAGKPVDVGAAWINDTNQSEVYALAKKLGLELTVQNTVGEIVQQDVAGNISTFKYGEVPKDLTEENGVNKLLDTRNIVEEVCQKFNIHNPAQSEAELDKITLEEFVTANGGGKTGLASAGVWTRAMLGMEPREMSAHFFLNYCKSGGGLMRMRSDQKDGGQYLRFAQGTQSLSFGLAALLKPSTLHLSNPVHYISQSPSTHTTVHAAKGTYHCKHIIISLPTPLYKDIQFSPPLPADKVALSTANKLGFINKVLLRYSTPWWRDYNLTGMIQSFTGPVCVTRDSSVDSNNSYSLTCFCAGDAGRELTKLSQQERWKAVKDQIRATLGVAAGEGVEVPEPIGIEEHEWFSDMWAQGCPCPASPPGVMTKYEKALRSRHGKVHFVGTETAFEWKGYMEGAIRAGKRGAREVVGAVRDAKL